MIFRIISFFTISLLFVFSISSTYAVQKNTQVSKFVLTPDLPNTYIPQPKNPDPGILEELNNQPKELLLGTQTPQPVHDLPRVFVPLSDIRPSYLGQSIVDYLHSIEMPFYFILRKRLAQQHGIENYTGTEGENINLLERLRNKIPPSSPHPDIQSNYTGPSIVDYLNSMGLFSNFVLRKELARKYAIYNYLGTVNQNLELLRMLRGNFRLPYPLSPFDNLFPR